MIEEPINTIVYSPGKGSTPWHSKKIDFLKIIAFKENINIISVKYEDGMTAKEMEDKLFSTILNPINVPGNLIFVGSSMGAYLSTKIAQRVLDLFEKEEIKIDDGQNVPQRKLLGQFLLSPAFGIKPEFYQDQNPVFPCKIINMIIHGYHDDIIDYKKIISFSEKNKIDLHLLNGNHRLSGLDKMISLLFKAFLIDCKKEADRNFKIYKINTPSTPITKYEE